MLRSLVGSEMCIRDSYWGAEFKMAGWDMVIFEGKSAKPVYLYVNDDTAELRDAAHLWGKSVWETEESLKKGLQDPLVRVSSIGKAGENQVLFAAVVHDLHRAAGRSGVGAVMGSKNLKAIAVRGTKGVGNIKNPQAFFTAVAEKKKILAENGVTGQGLPAYGTQVLMNVINEAGAMPTRNSRDVQFEGSHDISAEAMAIPRKTDGQKNLQTNQACFGCTIACGRISKIDETHFTIKNRPEYWHASGGLEYEAAWALGANTGVNDLEARRRAAKAKARALDRAVAEVEKEVATVAARLATAEFDRAQSEIRSPVAGRVLQLQVHAEGAVVADGRGWARTARAQGQAELIPLYHKNSTWLQTLSRKDGIEYARRGKLIEGYILWLLIDYGHWTEGLLDDFWSPKNITPEEFLKSNGDTVIVLAQDGNRCLPTGAKTDIPLGISHYGESSLDGSVLKWKTTGPWGAVEGEIPVDTLSLIHI